MVVFFIYVLLLIGGLFFLELFNPTVYLLLFVSHLVFYGVLKAYLKLHFKSKTQGLSSKVSKLSELKEFDDFTRSIIPIGLFSLDEEGYFIEMNSKCSEMLGINKFDVIGVHITELIPISEFQKNDALICYQLSGIDKFYSLDTTLYESHTGEVHVIGTLKDVTKSKKLEKTLWKQANIDLLTGAYSRSYGFKHILEKPVDHIVFIDVDGLKGVNDTYGHDYGDQLIKDMCDIIRTSVDCPIVRLGGDEFLLILDGDNPEKIMELIQDNMQEFNNTQDRIYKVDFSFGIAEHSEIKGEDVDSLISLADDRMLNMKKLRKTKRGELVT